jgi:hypothetical protein
LCSITCPFFSQKGQKFNTLNFTLDLRDNFGAELEKMNANKSGDPDLSTAKRKF